MNQVQVIATSTFYRSLAENDPGQPTTTQTSPDQRPRFVNGVWQIQTHLEPRELKFEVLRDIEDRLGRQRGGDKYGDRTIDLDLVLYDQCIMDDDSLKVPDPGIDRPFVAVPLAELAPDLVIPGRRRPLSEQIRPQDREGLEPLPDLTEKLRQMILRQGNAT